MIGQEWAIDLLKIHVAGRQLRHAYLFAGPQGVGRLRLALQFAAAINCDSPPEPGSGCGTCRNCRQILAGQHPDLAIVAAETPGGTLKVDQVRALQRSLSLSSYQARYRIAILDNFDDANPNAANALLKTLEEPPDHVILLLTAASAEVLLPTVTSRCEILRLRPVSVNALAQALVDRMDVDDEQAALLSAVSGGRAGQAIRLHQDPELFAERQSLLDEHQLLLNATQSERFELAESLAKDRTRFQSALTTWMSLWRDVLLQVSGAEGLTLANPDRQIEIDGLADRFRRSEVLKVLRSLEQAYERLARYGNARLIAEVLMLDLPI